MSHLSIIALLVSVLCNATSLFVCVCGPYTVLGYQAILLLRVHLLRWYMSVVSVARSHLQNEIYIAYETFC